MEKSEIECCGQRICMTVWCTRLKMECRKKRRYENCQTFFKVFGDMTRMKKSYVCCFRQNCVCVIWQRLWE